MSSSFSCFGCHGWIDPDRLGQGVWFWDVSNEAFGVTGPGGLKGPSALVQDALGSMVLRSAVLDWYRDHLVESPSSDRVDRIISAAVRSFETAFFPAYTASSQAQPGSGLMPCWYPPQLGRR